jgi:PKHD-type hydroxylase
VKFYRIYSEADAMAIAKTLSGCTWSAGLARTRELTGTTKQNGELLDHELLVDVGRRLISHGEIQLDHVPLKLHAPKFSRYADGQHYDAHTDAPWMGQTRTDLSMTLWLSDGYEGGDLVVAGERYRGKPGECLVYPCGQIHEVTPVTAGERICAVTWIQSRIRDGEKRRMVSDFRRFLAKVEGTPLFVEGGRIHSNLLRMWVE